MAKKSKYRRLPLQRFDVYAYKQHNLTAWEREYMPAHGSGVWVFAGTVEARSPWEAGYLARYVGRDGRDQRIPHRLRSRCKLRSQPSFERAD